MCSGSRLKVSDSRVRLHPRIVRTTATFWGHPDDVLRWVFDVAGFAVDAILGVDLQAVAVVFVLDEFVHTGRAIARFKAGVFRQVDIDWHAGVFQGQMRGLLFFVVGVADEDAAQAVKGKFAVWLGVVNWFAFRRGF